MDIDLDAAAEKGIISEDQAIALRNFEAAQSRQSLGMAEKFRIFGGLNDLTTAGGLALTLVAMSALLGSANLFIVYLALPAIAIKVLDRLNGRAWPCLAAVISVGSLLAICTAMPLTVTAVFRGPPRHDVLIFSGLLPASAYGWSIWRRTRHPILPAAIAGIIVFIVGSITQPEFGGENANFLSMNVAVVVTALAILAVGIAWDLTDVRRETERSQVAFWLHCISGLMLVRSTVALSAGQNAFGPNYALGIGKSGFVAYLAIVLFCFIISLILDRRSLLVSTSMPSITFWGEAYNELSGMLFVGVLLLISSVFWNAWRKRILSTLPPLVVAQLARTDIKHQGQRPTRRHLELRRLKRRP